VADSVLLDTCAAIWLMNGEALFDPGFSAMRKARSANVGIYVSAFTAWEIGTLTAKQRLQLTLAPDVWFETLLSMPGVRLAALEPKILFASTSLPGKPPSDPADRIIAATARLFGHIVVTRDRKLLDYARGGHIRVLKC
jgi:PIN domain nuclease of toxin-antitoxin system